MGRVCQINDYYGGSVLKITVKRILQAAAGLIALVMVSFIILVLINGKSSDELTNLRSETEGIWEKGAETLELSFESTAVSACIPVGYYVASDYEDTDGEYTTEKIIYKNEKLMLNLYLWKNSSDAMNPYTWISKINAVYYDDGEEHIQTMTVDGREVSYIFIMEAAAPEDELMYEDSAEAEAEREEQTAESGEPDGYDSGERSSEKDIAGKMNGVIYAVCPINEKVFYVVQVTEYDAEDAPKLSDYEKLFYLVIENEP